MDYFIDEIAALLDIARENGYEGTYDDFKNILLLINPLVLILDQVVLCHWDICYERQLHQEQRCQDTSRQIEST